MTFLEQCAKHRALANCHQDGILKVSFPCELKLNCIRCLNFFSEQSFVSTFRLLRLLSSFLYYRCVIETLHQIEIMSLPQKLPPPTNERGSNTKSYLDNLLNVSLALAFPLHHHWAMKSQKKLCWKGMQEAETLEILLILWTFDLKDGREHQQLLHSSMLIYSTQESEG